MNIINLAERSSVLNKFTANLRDINIQTNRPFFRHNVNRIGNVMAYEISKTMDNYIREVRTPLGIAPTLLPREDVVLATIMRAGIPFHQGFLDFFEDAENAFVSAYRKYNTPTDFEVRIEYLASPRLDGKTLIITDPMLATGSSMELCYKALLTKGSPAKLHLACIVASQPAIDFVRMHFPADTHIWCAAIDATLNDHAYIVPGLGDAGDLCYGEKSNN